MGHPSACLQIAPDGKLQNLSLSPSPTVPSSGGENTLHKSSDVAYNVTCNKGTFPAYIRGIDVIGREIFFYEMD